MRPALVPCHGRVRRAKTPGVFAGAPAALKAPPNPATATGSEPRWFRDVAIAGGWYATRRLAGGSGGSGGSGRRRWVRRLSPFLAFAAVFLLGQKSALASGLPVVERCLVDFLKAVRHYVAFSINDLLILLFSTTLVVPLMKRLRTSPIIGFLLIGLILGPAGVNVIQHVDVSHRIADFGIIFFLFETGLELSVKKVISMRADVFGLGMAQFFITGGLIAFLSSFLLPQLNPGALVLLGGGMALSSSAFALQLLRDKKQLGTRFGRASLGVLLFQDLAVVPLLVLAPLLSDPAASTSLSAALAEAFGKAMMALGIIVGTGHFLLRPLLTFVKRSDSSEAFLAMTLGTVLLSSSLTQAFGLSETLGAFVGGVLVAETDYKHQIEADIAPFRGMLLGLFFVTVGFSFDVTLLTHHWVTVLPLVALILLIKALVVVLLGVSRGLSGASAVQASALLAPGGEFALVLFRLAEQVGIMPTSVVRVLVTSSVLSMAVMPLLAAGADAFARRMRERRGLDNLQGLDERAAADVLQVTRGSDGFVVICGYNMIGRTICNLMDSEEAQYIVFEDDVAVARQARASGLPVFLADAARREVMENFKVGQARVVVVANKQRERTNQVATAIRVQYPKLDIIVRAQDRDHVKWLEKNLKVKAIMPAMIAVRFGTEVMQRLGYPEDEVKALLQEQLGQAIAEICGDDKDGREDKAKSAGGATA